MATGTESSLRGKTPFPPRRKSEQQGEGGAGATACRKQDTAAHGARGEGSQGRGVPMQEREGGHEENWI